MKNLVLVGFLAAFIVMTAADVAYAQAKGFDPDAMKGEFAEVIDFLFTVILGVFLVCGCYVIVMSLMDSKKYGFSHFAIALVVVLVAGISLSFITGLVGKDANEHYQSINEKRSE